MSGRRSTLHGDAAFRRRLSETLARVAQAREVLPITIVLGAPGSGKSSALLDVQRSCDRFVSVALDGDTTSLFGFVRALAGRLSPHVRGPEQSFAALHERLASSPDPVASIARWLAAHVGQERLTVAFDRFERVVDDARIVALIDALASCDSGLRFIIATRRMGGLPVDSWMSRGLMTMPLEMTGVPGLDVALRVDALRAAHRDLIERTVELPALDVALLGALGMAQAHETLRTMRAAHADLFEVGEALEYRYDVSAACVERLRREDMPRYAQIVRETGTMLERERRFDDALKLYIRTLQLEPLYRLLESHGLEVWETVSPDTLDVALRLVPRETQPESGIVLALRAAAASRAGRHDISETLYVNAMDVSSGSARTRIAYAYGCDLLRRNRGDAVDVLRSLTSEELEPEREAAIRSALAQGYCMREDRERANDEAARAMELATGADSWTSALVHTRAAYVKLYADEDLGAASELALRGLSLAQSCRAHVTAVGALSTLYNVACEYDDPVLAIPYLRDLADHSAKIGNVAFASYALLAELEFQVEAYDLAAVEETRQTLRSFDVHYEAQATSEALLPSEALQLAWSGEFARAYQILEPSIAQQQGEDFRALRTAQVALYAAAADALELAASLANDALSALARLDTNAQKAVRGRIYTALTLSILGQVRLSEELFAEIFAGVRGFPRLRALANLALLIHRLWNGDAVAQELATAFADARKHHFGGIAAMFARLPMSIAVRERVASTVRTDHTEYAKIVPLLERYHDVPVSL